MVRGRIAAVLLAFWVMLAPRAIAQIELPHWAVYLNCRPHACLADVIADDQTSERDSKRLITLTNALFKDGTLGGLPIIRAHDPDGTTDARYVAYWRLTDEEIPHEADDAPSIELTCDAPNEWRAEIDDAVCSIRYKGSIVDGFSDRLLADMIDHANSGSFLVSKLDIWSPGGSMRAGLNMGRTVRSKALEVKLPPDAKDGNSPIIRYCASACTFIFMASPAGREPSGSWQWLEVDDSAYDNIRFHNWFLPDPDRVSDASYMASYQSMESQVRQFLKEIGMPESLTEWVQSIPSRMTKPPSASLRKLIGEYPPALAELIYARCGLFMDDSQSAEKAARADISRDEWDRRMKIVQENNKASGSCIRRVVAPIQRKAQLGQ